MMCPRCGGPVHREYQLDGDELVCIVCGWRQYPKAPVAIDLTRRTGWRKPHKVVA